VSAFANGGLVVVDLRILQTADSRANGIARYARDFATALERHRPDLVGRYLLAPDLAPPDDLGELVATGKVAYWGSKAAIPDSARVYHSLSVLDVAASTTAIWPPVVEHLGLAYSASVHELIALRHSSEHPTGTQRRYRARCEILRLAEALLAMSPATRTDLIDIVGADEAAITVVGSGRPCGLSPPPSRAAASTLAQELVPGLGEGFVLCPDGTDSLDAVDAVIAGFALLPEELRHARRLAVYGDLPAASAAHLRDVASRGGIADQLLFTGGVSGRVLEALCQSAAVVCAPPLPEGFYLAIDAIACGAVVIAADIAQLDGLVPSEARFEARDPVSIAGVLARALSDNEYRAANILQAGSASWLQPWQDVVERAARVFEHLASGGRRPWRKGPRVALVSPFPPIASGVARYSSRLAEALSAELAAVAPGATLDCFVDGLDRLGSGPVLPTDPPPAGTGGWFDARHFIGIEKGLGGYERVVYVLGNSQFHGAALAALRRRSGTVMAHDVRMTDLLRHSSGMLGASPGGLEGAIRRTYGDAAPEGLGRNNSVSESDVERFGLLLLADVVPHADRLLVSSEAARRLAETDVDPKHSGRLGVLPFALALGDSELEEVAAARRERSERHRRLVASFGIVDPIKLPHLLVKAVATLRGHVDAEIAFVGPVSDSVANALVAQASALGIGDRVHITGHLERSVYLHYLGWATVAVQLRAGFGGEASAAVGDCLAAGLPTIVSDLGWMADLPSGTAVKLKRSSGSDELAGELAELFDDPDRRAQLSERAATYAADHTFQQVAEALLAALGLGGD
jgi:glycosyltransferase involved in cell wall biosynthesis